MAKVVWLPSETDYSYCKISGGKYSLFHCRWALKILEWCYWSWLMWHVLLSIEGSLQWVSPKKQGPLVRTIKMSYGMHKLYATQTANSRNLFMLLQSQFNMFKVTPNLTLLSMLSIGQWSSIEKRKRLRKQIYSSISSWMVKGAFRMSHSEVTGNLICNANQWVRMRTCILYTICICAPV